jgi:hypothetical protein
MYSEQYRCKHSLRLSHMYYMLRPSHPPSLTAPTETYTGTALVISECIPSQQGYRNSMGGGDIYCHNSRRNSSHRIVLYLWETNGSNMQFGLLSVITYNRYVLWEFLHCKSVYHNITYTHKKYPDEHTWLFFRKLGYSRMKLSGWNRVYIW